MDTPNNAFVGNMLAAARDTLLATGGSPKPTVHLVKAPFTPTPNLDFSTLTPADFDGYTPKDVTGWNIVHVQPNGQFLSLSSNVIEWVPTGSTTSNTIFGWYMKDINGVGVVCGLFNPQPVLLGNATTLAFVVGVGCAAWSYTTTPLS